MNFFAIFFGIFFPSSGTDEMRYKNFCSLFLPIGVLAKNNVGMRFFNFLNFLAIFFRIFLPWAEYERNSGLKFFSLVLGLYYPVLAINNAGIRSFHFLLFFSKFSSTVRVWTELGTRIFALIFCQSHPGLTKNNVGKRFFNILISFFSISYGIFMPGSRMIGIRDKIFFFSFSAYLIPFWLKIIPERGFLIFWILLLFFS